MDEIKGHETAIRQILSANCNYAACGKSLFRCCGIRWRFTNRKSSRPSNSPGEQKNEIRFIEGEFRIRAAAAALTQRASTASRQSDRRTASTNRNGLPSSVHPGSAHEQADGEQWKALIGRSIQGNDFVFSIRQVGAARAVLVVPVRDRRPRRYPGVRAAEVPEELAAPGDGRGARRRT